MVYWVLGRTIWDKVIEQFVGLLNSVFFGGYGGRVGDECQFSLLDSFGYCELKFCGLDVIPNSLLVMTVDDRFLSWFSGEFEFEWFVMFMFPVSSSIRII